MGGVSEGGNGNGMVIFTAGNGGVGRGAGGPVGDYDGGAAGAEEMDANADGQWLSNEHYSDAWQSTLFRLFGNTEIPMDGEGYVPTET